MLRLGYVNFFVTCKKCSQSRKSYQNGTALSWRMTERYSLRKRPPPAASDVNSLHRSYMLQTKITKHSDSEQSLYSEDDGNSSEENSYTPPSQASSDNDSSIATAPSTRSKHRRMNCKVQAQEHEQVRPKNFNVSNKFTEDELCTLRENLLEWYGANYRPLPWRASPRSLQSKNIRSFQQQKTCQSSPGAPYAVWVSEIMSQQTRISVVCEYWKRWMEVFPTVQALASAPLERVNELWSGLGYYRRARFLHEAAIQLVRAYDGELPRTEKELRKIKGIGVYTAGAIASIAFNERVPAVDGNVERVIARLRPGILPNTAPTTSKNIKAQIYNQLATDIITDIECAGDMNQALMELGATTCLPKRPKCNSCPVQMICGALNEAKSLNRNPESYVERYPAKDVSRKTKVREETVLVCVVSRKNPNNELVEYLLVQRPSTGLLGGLWECPNVVQQPSDIAAGTVAATEQRQLLEESLVDLLKRLKVYDEHVSRVAAGSATHIFSHIRQQLLIECLHVDDDRLDTEGEYESGRYQWTTEAELKNRAIATQMRKALKIGLQARVTTALKMS